jgi:hypothetical protein
MLSCDAILVRGRLRRKSALIHSPLVFAGRAAAETAAEAALLPFVARPDEADQLQGSRLS